jgi:hypothetical protein
MTMLEAALIHHFQNTPGHQNASRGGEGVAALEAEDGGEPPVLCTCVARRHLDLRPPVAAIL